MSGARTRVVTQKDSEASVIANKDNHIEVNAEKN